MKAYVIIDPRITDSKEVLKLQTEIGNIKHVKKTEVVTGEGTGAVIVTISGKDTSALGDTHAAIKKLLVKPHATSRLYLVHETLYWG